MSVYFVIDILVGLLFLVLAVLALVDKGYKKQLNRQFIGISIFLLTWMVSNQISTSIETPQYIAVIANYFLFASSLAATLMVTKLLVRIAARKRTQVFFKKVEVWLWLAVILSATPLVGNGVEQQGAVYGVIFGPGVIVYGISLLALIAMAIFVIYRGWHGREKRSRSQIRAIGIGFLIAAPLVLLLGFGIPVVTGNFEIAQISIAPLVILAFGIFFAVVRHGLFDVRAAVLRGVSYALVLVSLAFVYYLLAYGVSIVLFAGKMSSGMSISPLNVILALLLAFLFQPFKHFFDKLTNTLFYRGRYDVEDFYEHFSATVRSAVSLRQLMDRTVVIISETFSPESTSLYVRRDSGSIVSEGVARSNKIPSADLQELLDLKKPVHIDDSDLVVSVRRLMVSHGVAVVVPLYRNDMAVGVLCLGERRSSRFTHRDLRVLRIIAGELVVGIQNALAIQEIRDLNDHLQQRIDSATKELRRSNAQLQRLDETKDEFISMASHQLRTPLTSIKGYLSMLIDEDLGKVTPQQKQVLEEAFSSSERMVHLIGDFLNVSRLQTGKFVIDKQPTNLSKLVKREVESLQKTADGHDLKLKYSTSKDIPEMNIDADKFKQVIMNFIDNAIYYSKEGTTVQISVKRNGSSVEFLVKDTGIGVPQSEQAGLFGKFFRASNARRTRPDGTGVGLFLAKKVVSDHRGQVIFESEEGKGSTFGFSLPLPAEQVQK